MIRANSIYAVLEARQSALPGMRPLDGQA